MLAHPVRIVDEVGVFSQPFGDLWVAVEELVKVVHLAPRDVALFALLFLEALLPVHECCRVFLQLLSRTGKKASRNRRAKRATSRGARCTTLTSSSTATHMSQKYCEHPDLPSSPPPRSSDLPR